MKTTDQKEIIADKNLIAFCGLYCGACRGYLKGTCPGCRDNVKAAWCKLRKCCIEYKLDSCSDCKAFAPKDCKKCNNIVSKMFGLVFNSDRLACLSRIKEIGYDDYAAEMAGSRKQTIKRK